MHVANGLCAVASVIYGHPIAGLMQPFRTRHVCGGGEQAACEFGIVPQGIEAFQMPPRHDEDVYGSLGSNIAKGDERIIRVDLGRGNIARRDLAEETTTRRFL